MRVLHTSDWHLGRLLRSVPLVDHQRGFLVWLADLASAREVDAILVSGDIYDRAIPSVEAIAVLEEALATLGEVCPVILTSGNHDSTVRLGFAHRLLERAGIHVRTDPDEVANPITLTSGSETLLVYALPYMEPELVRTRWGVEKSHDAVLTAAMDRVRADLESRSISPAGGRPRSVVMAHAFITGGTGSDSERDVSVGGVNDAPASVFSGVDYVALGHLHSAQQIAGPGGPLVHYSGSPLAYSFSEEAHVKSVSLVDLPPDGPVTVETIATPVPRRLATITGTVDDLLDDEDLTHAEDAWVRAIVTDARRPEHAMDRLQARFPHTLELAWLPPQAGLPVSPPVAGAAGGGADPVALVLAFIEHVTGAAAGPEDIALVRESVERVRIVEMQS
ncbi:MAG: exonuclease subunit SbcD [Actinomycetales bacterium]|nr:exonuclease subunit SbcD [Actinomycetales bacterium]